MRRVGGIDLSHHHFVVSGCRLVDGQTPPMRVPCPPTVRHLPRLLYLPYTCPAPFSPDHPSLPSSLHHPSIPPSFSADLPISEVTRTGPADGSSSAVSAASVAASVLHVVQSRSRFFICFCFLRKLFSFAVFQPEFCHRFIEPSTHSLTFSTIAQIYRPYFFCFVSCLRSSLFHCMRSFFVLFEGRQTIYK